MVMMTMIKYFIVKNNKYKEIYDIDFERYRNKIHAIDEDGNKIIINADDLIIEEDFDDNRRNKKIKKMC